MARDSPDTPPASSPLRRAPSRPISRSLPRPPGKPLAAAKASAKSAPDPRPPASLRYPPKNAKSPRSSPPPAHIFQLIASGTHRADTAHRPATAPPAPASPSATAPGIPPSSAAASEILRYRGHQPRRKILRHPVQRRIAFLKEVPHIGGKLIFVPEEKTFVVVEHFFRRAVLQSHLTGHRHQHRLRLRRAGSGRGRRLEQQRHHF